MELLELGKKPISDATPTGVPSRDDPAYEALQAEFRKLELPDPPRVEWPGVIKNASELLGTKSKDVMAGVYLAMALFEQDGYSGLANGLTVLNDMVSTYWETLHPERARPRQTAFQYLGERGGRGVAMRGTQGAKREDLERIVDMAEKLDAFLSQKLEGGKDLLGELLRQARDVKSQTSSPAPPLSATPALGTQSMTSGGASSSYSTPTVPGSITNEQEFDAAVKALGPALRALGNFKRATNPRDPMAYRLPRIAIWMAIRQAPDATAGATKISPPQPADSLAKLEAKLAAQQWAGVLEETESRMTTAMYWLDLHYCAYTALRGMGPDYFSASEAVATEVRGLVQRLPELGELSFAGGMPLASPATRSWIADTVMAAPGSGGGARSARGLGLALSADGAEPDGLAEARTQASALVAEGKLAAAVRLFEAGAARAIRARERTAWKVAVAAVCAEAARHDVALAQLEALQDDLQETTLEAWDPELASAMLRLMLAARQKAVPAGAGPDEAQKTRELLRRLARLDAAAALEFQRPAQ